MYPHKTLPICINMKSFHQSNPTYDHVWIVKKYVSLWGQWPGLSTCSGLGASASGRRRFGTPFRKIPKLVAMDPRTVSFWLVVWNMTGL